MSVSISTCRDPLDRRGWLRLTAAGLASLTVGPATGSRADPPKPDSRGKPTTFQIACMTLPYAPFPLERALTGIHGAGYRYVAWGTGHADAGGKRVPVLADDASPAQAKELAQKCCDLGLEPVLLFGPPPENVEAFRQRLRQAAAAGVAQVLTMGTTRGNDPRVWVKSFQELGPMARDLGVLIVAKQHGGNTGTGAGLAEIVRAVADDGVKISYDAGNVLDYNRGKVNPLEDIRTCADEVRGFCIKDHRFFPKDQDCGPGLGEIDHYRLLAPVAFTGRTVPLCCENVYAPALPVPAQPERVDVLARRAREFLELVIQGLQA
jgi:sugar phosphate isomerase/epimerase